MKYEKTSVPVTPTPSVRLCGGVDDSADPADPLFKEGPAAKILTVSVSALQAWRRTGQGPLFLKIGGAVRYRHSDLLRFLAECERGAA